MVAESLTPPPGFLTFVGCVLFVLFVYSMVLGIQEKRGRIKAQAENKPLEVNQPLRVENVTPSRYVEVHVFEDFKKSAASFVTTATFNAHYTELSGRLTGLEKQISKQVADTEKYTHEMRHEFRDELQAIRSAGNLRGEELHEQIAALNKSGEDRITKVHDRVNDVLRVVSELSGAFNQSQKGRAG